MKRLYLIRHGEPASGWGDVQGSTDPGLTPHGRAQAQAAAETLMALSPGRRPTRVLTSPMRRCRETAQPFAHALGVDPIVDPAVTEIPTPADVAHADRAAWLKHAMEGEWGAITGIDGAAWRRSVVDALLRAEGAAVFTHFVAINAAVTAAQGTEAVITCKPAPGSVTTLEIIDTRLRVVALGQSLSEAGRVL